MYYNNTIIRLFSKVNHLQIIYNRALAVFRAIFPGHLQRRAAGSATRRPRGGCGRAPSFGKSVVSTWVIIIYVYYIIYNIILYYMLYVSVIFYSYAIRCITVGISCVYVTCNACINCNLFGWFSLILHMFLMFIRSQVQTLPCGHCCCHRFARLRCHFLRRKPSPRFMDRSRWRYA
jgi:hypothetical protein